MLEKIRDLLQTQLLFENVLQLFWRAANPNTKKESENAGILNAIFSACPNKNGAGSVCVCMCGGATERGKKAVFAF